MMKVSFRRKLTRGDLLIGTIITLPSPEITEIFCQSGFDWLFVDLEHSALSIKDAQVILQSAAQQVSCVIRVPSINEIWIKKALDIGPSGIIIPNVQTAEEAKLVVQLCKYPPEGVRSVGTSRASGYGENFQEYVATANDETAVIIQIEHRDAVNNIEDIIKVSGIDCLFVGPYDLSASMGKTGLTTDPDVQNAIMQVKKCAEQEKIPLGIFGATADAVKPYIQSGFKLIAVGADTLLIGKAAKNITDRLK
jgi:2-dehydro-3-deoxyglucarate aldolase